MISPRPHRLHLENSQSLVTSYEATRAGFVALALERSRRATPFIAQAKALRAAALTVSTPADLVRLPDVQVGLLVAAGVSDKAERHLQPEDKREAIRGLVANHLEPAGGAFVEELVYRFLLTRGDSLGGEMRNVGGVLAQREFARAVISALTVAGIPYRWQGSATRAWAAPPEDPAAIEFDVKGLAWTRGSTQRTLLYNVRVPLVRKSVDLCLFDCGPDTAEPAHHPELLVAAGELKGGIDPAGADEHWKTANSALGRIRESFSTQRLNTFGFFVAAAIQPSMAVEIWEQLEDRRLANAANLSDGNQVASLCRWLVSL